MSRPRRAATQKQNVEQKLDLSEFEDEDESDGDFSSQSSDEYDPNEHESDEEEEADIESSINESKEEEQEEEEESSPKKGGKSKSRKSNFNNKNKTSKSAATLRKEVISKFKSSASQSKGSSQKLQDIFKKAQFNKYKNLLNDSDDEKTPNFDCSGGLNLSDSSDSEVDEIKPKRVLQVQRKTSQEKISDDEADRNIQKMKEIAAKLAGSHSTKSSSIKKNSSQKENVDVADLLAMGEGGSKAKRKIMEDSDSDNWEDVEDDSREHKIPKEGVEILLNEFPANDKNGKVEKPVDVEAQLKRKFNRRRKEFQEHLHKTELLSWIVHGNFVNVKLNDMDLIKNALKLLPPNGKQCYPKEKTDENYFKEITTWFRKQIALSNQEMYCTRLKSRPPLMMSLALQMKFKKAICRRDYILIYIILLRAIGIQCRMVQSIVCDPKICPKSELMSLATKPPPKSKSKLKVPQVDGGDNEIPRKSQRSLRNANSANGKTENIKRKSIKSTDAENFSPTIKISTDSPNRATKPLSKDPKKRISEVALHNRLLEKAKGTSLSVVSPRKTRSMSRDEPLKPSTSKEAANHKKTKAVKDTLKIVLPRSTRSRSKSTEDKETKNSTQPKPNLLKLKRKAEDSSQAPIPSKISRQSTTSPADNKRKRSADDKNKSKKNEIKNKKSRISKEKEDNESEDESLKYFKIKNSSSRAATSSANSSKIDRRLLSSEDEEEETVKYNAISCIKSPVQKKTKGGIDIWVEVYSEKDERWMSIDVFRGKVDCVKEICEKATHPLVYVFAWNNDNSIKDVSARYCTKLNTTIRKMRVDRDYLNSVLNLFPGTRTARDFKEDDELNKLQLKESMPTSIAEFKNHPLYALKRHLLKFQAIYPPEPPILGYIREEAIYPRDCVFTLHSRETWLKEARVVKLYEKPYKMVTTMKWDRVKNKVIKDVPLELFGVWQTKDYEPPVAENGVVPRNGYGNVELFKPCMLPVGTVHLQLPQLNKVCRKLGVDCAQAVVGFDSSGGWPYPVYDGFIICKEFEEKVIDAWNREQEEMERKEREKIDKRVYGNWKKLIKGLLIRERLKIKYNFEQKS